MKINLPKINLPKIKLSKSQSAALGIVGYFTGRAVLDTVQTGKIAPRDVFNAALAGVLTGCRSLLPDLSGKGNTDAGNTNSGQPAGSTGTN